MKKAIIRFLTMLLIIGVCLSFISCGTKLPDPVELLYSTYYDWGGSCEYIFEFEGSIYEAIDIYSLEKSAVESLYFYHESVSPDWNEESCICTLKVSDKGGYYMLISDECDDVLFLIPKWQIDFEFTYERPLAFCLKLQDSDNT